jgi:hypothetical protein
VGQTLIYQASEKLPLAFQKAIPIFKKGLSPFKGKQGALGGWYL